MCVVSQYMSAVAAVGRRSLHPGLCFHGRKEQE